MYDYGFATRGCVFCGLKCVAVVAATCIVHSQAQWCISWWFACLCLSIPIPGITSLYCILSVSCRRS